MFLHYHLYSPFFASLFLQLLSVTFILGLDYYADKKRIISLSYCEFGSFSLLLSVRICSDQLASVGFLSY